MMPFIVRTTHRTWPYVVAPAGYNRTGPTTIERDRSCGPNAGPEYGASDPWLFKTHRAAARQATKCCGTVEERK